LASGKYKWDFFRNHAGEEMPSIVPGEKPLDRETKKGGEKVAGPVSVEEGSDAPNLWEKNVLV
jgi:hypothetical protein